jgi:hypothetical protein
LALLLASSAWCGVENDGYGVVVFAAGVSYDAHCRQYVLVMVALKYKPSSSPLLSGPQDVVVEVIVATIVERAVAAALCCTIVVLLSAYRALLLSNVSLLYALLVS